MNVFELTAVLSPVVGAIAGGMSVKTAGAAWMALGIILGLVVGVAAYFAAIGVCALLLRAGGKHKADRLRPVQWAAEMTGVLLVMASPIGAWAAASAVVGKLLHL